MISKPKVLGYSQGALAHHLLVNFVCIRFLGKGVGGSKLLLL